MGSRRDHRAWRFGVFVAIVFTAIALTQDAAAGASSKRALVLAKALSFERRLAERKGGSVGIAAVYAKGNDESLAAANAWKSAMSSVGIKVHGAPVVVIPVAVDAAKPSFLRSKGIDVLLACQGVSPSEVHSLAKRHGALSVADEEKGVRKGLSLGVFVSGSKPRIVINMRAAKSEGAKFSGKLLQLAEVI